MVIRSKFLFGSVIATLCVWAVFAVQIRELLADENVAASKVVVVDPSFADPSSRTKVRVWLNEFSETRSAIDKVMFGEYPCYLPVDPQYQPDKVNTFVDCWLQIASDYIGQGDVVVDVSVIMFDGSEVTTLANGFTFTEDREFSSSIFMVRPSVWYGWESVEITVYYSEATSETELGNLDKVTVGDVECTILATDDESRSVTCELPPLADNALLDVAQDVALTFVSSTETILTAPAAFTQASILPESLEVIVDATDQVADWNESYLELIIHLTGYAEDTTVERVLVGDDLCELGGQVVPPTISCILYKPYTVDFAPRDVIVILSDDSHIVGLNKFAYTDMDLTDNSIPKHKHILSNGVAYLDDDNMPWFDRPSLLTIDFDMWPVSFTDVPVTATKVYLNTIDSEFLGKPASQYPPIECAIQQQGLLSTQHGPLNQIICLLPPAPANAPISDGYCYPDDNDSECDGLRLFVEIGFDDGTALYLDNDVMYRQDELFVWYEGNYIITSGGGSFVLNFEDDREFSEDIEILWITIGECECVNIQITPDPDEPWLGYIQCDLEEGTCGTHGEEVPFHVQFVGHSLPFWFSSGYITFFEPETKIADDPGRYPDNCGIFSASPDTILRGADTVITLTGYPLLDLVEVELDDGSACSDLQILSTYRATCVAHPTEPEDYWGITATFQDGSQFYLEYELERDFSVIPTFDELNTLFITPTGDQNVYLVFEGGVEFEVVSMTVGDCECSDVSVSIFGDETATVQCTLTGCVFTEGDTADIVIDYGYGDESVGDGIDVWETLNYLDDQGLDAFGVFSVMPPAVVVEVDTTITIHAYPVDLAEIDFIEIGSNAFCTDITVLNDREFTCVANFPESEPGYYEDPYVSVAFTGGFESDPIYLDRIDIDDDDSDTDEFHIPEGSDAVSATGGGTFFAIMDTPMKVDLYIESLHVGDCVCNEIAISHPGVYGPYMIVECMLEEGECGEVGEPAFITIKIPDYPAYSTQYGTDFMDFEAEAAATGDGVIVFDVTPEMYLPHIDVMITIIAAPAGFDSVALDDGTECTNLVYISTYAATCTLADPSDSFNELIVTWGGLGLSASISVGVDNYMALYWDFSQSDSLRWGSDPLLEFFCQYLSEPSFDSIKSLHIGNYECVGLAKSDYISDAPGGEITCTLTGWEAGTHAITVELVDGSMIKVEEIDLEDPVALLNGISHVPVSMLGGEILTISGLNFPHPDDAETIVSFWSDAESLGEECQIFLQTSTVIQCTTPYLPIMSNYNVMVTVDGNELDLIDIPAYAFNGFSTVWQPLSVSPRELSTAGNEEVVIIGQYFDAKNGEVTDITLAGLSATSFTEISATRVNAISPSESESKGWVEVTLENDDGYLNLGTSSSTGRVRAYFFDTPRTKLIYDPLNWCAPLGGGVTITITAIGNFGDVSGVTLAGVTATTFTATGTILEVTVPASSAPVSGPLEITSTDTEFYPTTRDFEYFTTGVITSVSPAGILYSNSRSMVTIYGSHLALNVDDVDVANTKLADLAITKVHFVSASMIIVTAAPSDDPISGLVTITSLTFGETVSSADVLFHYQPQITIESFDVTTHFTSSAFTLTVTLDSDSADHIEEGAEVTATIAGTSLAAVVTAQNTILIEIDETDVPYAVQSKISLTFADWELTTTSRDSINFITTSFVSIEPLTASIGGNDRITIIGTGWKLAKAEQIQSISVGQNAIASSGISVWTDTKLVFTVPEADSVSTGPIIIVTDLGTIESSEILSLTFPPAVISDIAPLTASVAGGDLITITGKYFAGFELSDITDFTIAGVAIDVDQNIESKSATEIVVRLPSTESVRTGKVIMEINGQGTMESAQEVTLDLPVPVISSVEPLEFFLQDGGVLTISGLHFSYVDVDEITVLEIAGVTLDTKDMEIIDDTVILVSMPVSTETSSGPVHIESDVFGTLESDEEVAYVANPEPDTTLEWTSDRVSIKEGKSYLVITYTLTDEPVGTVTFELETTERATLTPSTLVFDSNNWDTGIAVTLELIDDDEDQGNGDCVVTAGNAVAPDDDIYTDQTIVATFECLDDEAGATSIIITAAGSIASGKVEDEDLYAVNENTSGDITVHLSVQPLADLVVQLMSDSDSITVTSAPFTFTTSNWNVPQTASLTAVNDAEDLGLIDVQITAYSDDEDYQVESDTIDLIVIDNDSVAKLKMSGVISLTESQPCSAIKILVVGPIDEPLQLTMSVNDTTAATLPSSTMTITSAQLNKRVSVEVCPFNNYYDDIVQWWQSDIVASYNVLGVPQSESHRIYGSTASASKASLNISATNMAVNQTGDPQDIFLVMTSRPRAPVTYTVTFSTAGQVTASPAVATVASTLLAWNTSARITLEGLRAEANTADVTLQATITSTSSDPDYNQKTFVVTVVNELITWPTIGSIQPEVVGPDTPVSIAGTFDPESRIYMAVSTATRALPSLDSMTPVTDITRPDNNTVVIKLPPSNVSGYKSLFIINKDGGYVKAGDGIYTTSACPRVGFLADAQGNCTTCPPGAYCPGGGRIWALAGYWSPGEFSGVVTRCSVASNCLGGRFSTCAAGTMGTTCSSCAANFYVEASGTCGQCPATGDIAGLFIAQFVVFAIVIGTIVFAPQTWSAPLTSSLLVLRSLWLVTSFGATSGMPTAVSTIFGILQLFVGDWRFVKLQCLGLTSYNTLFGFNVGLNLAMFVPLVVACYIQHRYRLSQALKSAVDTVQRSEVIVTAARQFRVTVFKATHMLTSLLWMILVSSAVQGIHCFAAGTTSTLSLAIDPATSCVEGNTIATHLFSITILLLLVLMWPIMNFALAFVNKDNKTVDAADHEMEESPKIESAWGQVVIGDLKPFQWWLSPAMSWVFDLFLVLSMVLIRRVDPGADVVVKIVLFGVALLYMIIVRPFKEWSRTVSHVWISTVALISIGSQQLIEWQQSGTSTTPSINYTDAIYSTSVASAVLLLMWVLASIVWPIVKLAMRKSGKQYPSLPARFEPVQTAISNFDVRVTGAYFKKSKDIPMSDLALTPVDEELYNKNTVEVITETDHGSSVAEVVQDHTVLPVIGHVTTVTAAPVSVDSVVVSVDVTPSVAESAPTSIPAEVEVVTELPATDSASSDVTAEATPVVENVDASLASDTVEIAKVEDLSTNQK